MCVFVIFCQRINISWNIFNMCNTAVFLWKSRHHVMLTPNVFYMQQGAPFPFPTAPGLDFSKTTCILYSLPLPEQFEIQKLRIYCDPEQNNRETACEIPGVVSTRILDVSVLAHSDKFHLLMLHQIRSDLIFEIFYLITRPFFKKSLKTDK